MTYKVCSLEDSNDAITEVNEDNGGIKGWASDHGMRLNAGKTKSILISTPANNSKIKNFANLNKILVDDVEIPFDNEVKYLGFHFNNEFTSSNHTTNIIKKINFSLSKIASSRKFNPKPVRIRIVKGVIGPIFDYVSIIYHGYSIFGTCDDEKRLQRAQNPCVRYIYNLPKYEHITPFMKELRLLVYL